MLKKHKKMFSEVVKYKKWFQETNNKMCSKKLK